MEKSIPMEQRLKTSNLHHQYPEQDPPIVDQSSTNRSNFKGPVIGESMAVLLAQGLQSGDEHILDQVFDKNDDAAIISTVEHLPVQSIPQLLKELSNRFKIKTDLRPYVKWLRYALINNLSYISSNPEVLEQVCSYYHEFESRVNLMDSMLKLQGKINFLMDQFDFVHKQGQFSSDASALATYEDASSSDTESEADHQEINESDSEKNWNDLDWKEDEQEVDENEQSEEEEYLSLSKESKVSKKGSESSDEEMRGNDHDESEDLEEDSEDDKESNDDVDYSMEMG